MSWVTYQTSVNKKIEIVSGIFSDHNIMRLDINYKKKKKKATVSSQTPQTHGDKTIHF